MKKTPANELLIGAHTSAQGGAQNAIWIGQEIGATTIQLFTSNQKRWQGKTIGEEDIANFKEAVEATGLKKIMSHDSYLINLGSPNPEGLMKSQKAFREELIRCQKLGLAFLNFHPGAALDSTPEECLGHDRQRACSNSNTSPIKAKTRLLLETTAGQGSSVGHRFEHLGYLIEDSTEKSPSASASTPATSSPQAMTSAPKKRGRRP